MSRNHDELTQLDSLSESLDAAEVPSQSKATAIQAARKAFEADQARGQEDTNSFQGNVADDRPIGTSIQQEEGSMIQSILSSLSKPAALGLGATTCLVLIGVFTLSPKPADESDIQALQPPQQLDAETRSSPEKVAIAAQADAEDKKDQIAAVAPQSVQPPVSSTSTVGDSASASAMASADTAVQISEESALISAKEARSNNTGSARTTLAGKPIAVDSATAGRVKVESLRRPQTGVIPGPRPIPYPQDSVEVSKDTSRFDAVQASQFVEVSKSPVSTFSLDVDTASYAHTRMQLQGNRLPSPEAIRLEEMVNYFDYQYPTPANQAVPFSLHYAVSASPWNPKASLIHIGVKGFEVPRDSVKGSNLVFLLDVSGSMSAANKLPLLKQSMALLLDNLSPDDTVGIVVYAGAAGAVLEPTPVKEKASILDAIKNLKAGGSTAGAQGIELAYQMAQKHFKKDAVNRVILATDGDFNVGVVGDDNLQKLIEDKRKSGITLTVLGFGNNNYQDAMMQRLAQFGNGNAAYIDGLNEAKKVLVDEALSTLLVIAKDVKVQVEFNPAKVAAYRLLGYQSRKLNERDFENDKVDAGDIGSGHTITALYEVELVGDSITSDRRYAQNRPAAADNRDADSEELAYLKVRYKLPNASKSKLVELPINANHVPSKLVQQEFGFARAVAGFALLLSNDPQLEDFSFAQVKALAKDTQGNDPFNYRSEFLQLVDKAALISTVDNMR